MNKYQSFVIVPKEYMSIIVYVLVLSAIIIVCLVICDILFNRKLEKTWIKNSIEIEKTIYDLKKDMKENYIKSNNVIPLYQTDKWKQALNEKNPHKAIELYTELLLDDISDNEHSSIINNMAIRYTNLGEFEKSNELFESIELRDFVCQNISYNYTCLKDYDSAKGYIEKAIQMTPSYHGFYTSLAEINILENNFEVAKELLEVSKQKSIEVNGSDVYPSYSIDLAIIYSIENDVTKAIEQIEYCKKANISLEEILNKIEYIIKYGSLSEYEKEQLQSFSNEICNL